MQKLDRLRGFADWVKEHPGLSVQGKQEIGKNLEQVQTDILAGRYSRGEATQKFQEHVKKSFNIDDQQARAAMVLVEARAAARGQNTEDFILENFAGISESQIDEQGNIKPDILFQDAEHSNMYQRKLLRDIKAQIKQHPAYQTYAEAARIRSENIVSRLGRKLDFGANLGDVKQYIDGISGKGYLWRYVSNVQGEGQPWDTWAQELAFIQSGDDTGGYGEQITDPYTLIQVIDDALMATREGGGFSEWAYSQAKKSGDVSFDMLATKYDSVKGGESIEAINAKMRDLAEGYGISPDEVAAELILSEVEAGRQQRQKERKAATQFLEDGRAVLHAFKGADLSSVVHELAHVFRRSLSEKELATVEKWAGVTDSRWTEAAEEKFARGFERYLYDGKTANQQLRAVFTRLRAWLREIYERLSGSSIDIEIAPEVRKVFDTMLASREIHPGEMTFDDFFEKLGTELMNKNSDWIRQYTSSTVETPTQMHKRLKKEWQAQRNLETFSELKASEDLSAEQRRQIDAIEAAAKKTDLEVFASQKSMTIAELLDRNAADVHLIHIVKEELKAAFLKGRQEGIEKLKKRYQDTLSKVRARRELREYIQKLARQISRPAPATVDLFYREAIALLQAGIDPSFRKRKTLNEREATRKFLEQYPDRDLPYKLMQTINKKALNEYTIAELEDLAKEVSRLVKQGKLKRDLRLEQHKRKLDNIISEIVGNMTGTRPIDVDTTPVAASTRKKPPVKTFLKSARAATLRPSRIFDLFDGGKGTFSGIMHKTFYDAVNQAYDAKLRKVNERMEAGNKILTELGLTLKDLAGKRIVNNVEFSVQELLGIYGYSLNIKSRLAVVFGNRISNRMIEEIRHHVENEDPRLSKLVHWMIGEFDQHFDRLEEAFIEMAEKRLIKEVNYLPMRRQEVDYTPDRRQILNEMLERQHFKRAYAEKGFTIQRQDIPDEFQKPIRLELWNLWAEQVNAQEHLIHLGALTRDLHRIERNEHFSEAVKSVFGEEYLKEVQDYVSRVANPHIYKGYGYFERISRTLRRNAAISYLAFNLVTILNQLPSLLYYLPDAGAGNLLASVASFVRNPRAMLQAVESMDPQVKQQEIERVLEEIRLNDAGRYQGLVRQFGETGMKGIYLLDKVSRVIGWDAVYQKALSENLSQEEAIRLAQNATLRTQSAASAKDIASVYASNEALNWILMFSNQLSQIYNIATYDIPAAFRNQQYMKAGLGMMGVALGALVIWSISHRRPPEDAADLIDAMKEQAITMVPLFGNTIMAAERGFGGSGVGPTQQIGQLYKAGKNIVTLDADTDDLFKILESTAVLYGVPSVGPKRVYRALETGEPMELIGGE
jgi:hypothetical protein